MRHVASLETVSPDLKRDILGVRDKVMFVEGEITSLDTPLYANCFPGWKVAPRGGHEKVQEAVRALNDNSDLHWMEVVGIVDGDGRQQSEIEALKASKIITLPVPAVENLFFLPDVIKEVAIVLSNLHGGDPQQAYASADVSVGQIVQTDLDEIVHRRTTWLANRKLAEGKLSVQQVRNGISIIPEIDVESIKGEVQTELTAFLSSPSLEAMKKLPVKNTGIPAKVVQSLGVTLKRYKQIVLRQLELNSVEGQNMRAAIMREMPVLP
jgi:hypothetical protein